jgi:topoisomerase-4 subunit A
MLVFSLSEVNELGRGRGVRLQRVRDGGLADATVFTLAEGLRWQEGSRTRTYTEDLTEWQGNRAGAGRVVPKGFPRANRFGITGLD